MRSIGALESGEIHVHQRHGEEVNPPCSECRTAFRLYDQHSEWPRHLETCQYQTILNAAPPRSECPITGVRGVKLPWAEPWSRFTVLIEALAIAWLKAASQKGRWWPAVETQFERDLRHHGAGGAARPQRRQAEVVSQIGVDEKAFRNSRKRTSGIMTGYRS